ncbi:MAG: 5'-nucleotidase C-terminal domain-containing protein, partial [Candidatus Wallbacteria bacterium]|nr:5'-nucleotidase C-terminal domain-containing protein [Candidatus Wallbacteria bacterium]
VLIIGLTPPNTRDQTLKQNVEGLEFLNLGATVAKHADAIRGSDLVIILTQFTRDELADNLHFLNEFNQEFVVVFNAFDDARIALEKFSENTFIIGHDGVARGTSFERFTVQLDNGRIRDFSFSRKKVVCNEITPDSKLSSVMKTYRRKIDGVIHEKVGMSAQNLAVDNFAECALGNWVCDLMLRDSGAEMAITNSSGMRGGFATGEIDLEQIYRFFPFDNAWVCMKLSGSDLMALMERCYIRNQPIFQLSGGTIAVNREREKKVVSFNIQGQPLDLNREYLVVTNSFLAEGGDGYVEFLSGTERRYGPLIRNLLIDSLRSGAVLTGGIEGRILFGVVRDGKL